MVNGESVITRRKIKTKHNSQTGYLGLGKLRIRPACEGAGGSWTVVCCKALCSAADLIFNPNSSYLVTVKMSMGSNFFICKIAFTVILSSITGKFTWAWAKSFHININYYINRSDTNGSCIAFLSFVTYSAKALKKIRLPVQSPAHMSPAWVWNGVGVRKHRDLGSSTLHIADSFFMMLS